MSFKKKQGAFSRFISVLLTLCMAFSAFPLSALAADVADAAADNAWKRMLEIGIVDEDGELIEDTAFTLADGREAYSITEFLDMIDAEDTDPDMTVRRVAYGCGVEKTFPIHSPNVAKVEVIRKGKVRRAKLYYIRERVGKASKVKELI